MKVSEVGNDPEQWLEDCPQRVFDNWYAAYRLRPFGDEQELLTRIVSLLILIAGKEVGIEAAKNASDSIMRSLMTSEWVGMQNETKSKPTDSIATFESVVARAFG